MSRGREGQGTFRVTKTGKVEYRIPYYDEMDIRRIKSFTCDTEAECRKRADEFIYITELKKIDINESSTLPEIIRKKLDSDYRKNYMGEQGYDRNLHTLEIIERSFLSYIPISAVTSEDIDIFLNSVTPYSNKIIRSIFSMLRSAFRLAYDRRLIASNLIEYSDIRRPASQKVDSVIKGLTEKEQKAYIKALDSHKVPYGRNNYKLQLKIALLTGMRMGEINALRPEDVFIKEGYIHVERTISRGLHDRPFIKEGTKTDAGYRDVPISESVKPILEQALSEAQPNPYGLIFYDYEKDGLITTSQVNCFHKRICRKANIPECGQHALRHTFATRCIEAGIDPLVLKTWLGHTDIHITLDTYADVFEQMNMSSVNKLDRLLDAVM